MAKKEPIYKFIDINKIEANINQPRTHFEEEKIQELSVSIKENGLLQPIVVRPKGLTKYEIVVGERRYRACKLAGIKEIPCIVNKMNEEERQTAALVENIQRENLSAIEEALAYQQIIDTQGLTQAELAKQVGKQQSTVANKLRLLQLPLDIQESIRHREITERHARALLKLETPEKQKKVLKEIKEKGLTVDATEKRVKSLTTVKPPKSKGTSKAISQNLKIALNTLDQAIDMISRAGVNISVERHDNPDDFEYVIVMKK